MMTGQLLSLVSSVGPAVGNHLWQSTVFAALAGLMTLLLRKRIASARYGLWLAASVKFFIPFSLLIGLGGLLAKPQHVAIEPQMQMYSALKAASQPFPETAKPAVTAHTASSMKRFAARLPLVLAVVWLCGLVAVLLVWFARWRRVSAIQQRAVLVQEGREVEILRRLESLAKTRTRIPLLLSQELMEPGVFGVFQPVLLWPERLSAQLEDIHLEAILAHEIMHARRYDNLTAAIHMLVEAAFWFHPMVWWIESRMVREREWACDEAVVHLIASPDVYAESLLKTCRFCLASPLVCVSGVTGGELRKRIVRIMAESVAQKLDLSNKLFLGAAGLLSLTFPFVFGVVHAAQVRAQSQEVPEWQTAAGGKIKFEVASVHLDQSGGM